MRIWKSFVVFLIFIFLFETISIADDLNSEENISDDVDFNLENYYNKVNISTENDLHILSRKAVVYERNSKVFLYEKNADEKCAMASTTKIMTCMIILENCDLNDVVTISKKASLTGGSRLGLTENDKISVNDLLYGLMLCSGNDAAVALAEFCGGSVEDFANLMNSKASDLNLASTHFVTPHGLDDENHFTTAKDFAILTDYALNNPLFVQIVGTKSYNVSINSNQKTITNTNELLGKLPSVYGVKTGYTSKAGRCLITSAKQNNLDIIVVVFGADTKSIRTSDSANLINYIFENYDSIPLSELIDEKYQDYLKYVEPYIKLEKASSSISSYYLSDEIPKNYPVKKELINSVCVNLIENNLVLPISRNQPIAGICVIANNSIIYVTNIYSDSYINKKQPADYLFFFIREYKNFYRL